MTAAETGRRHILHISGGYVLHVDALADSDICIPKVVRLAVLIVGRPARSASNDGGDDRGCPWG